MAPAQALTQARHVPPVSVTPPVRRVSCSCKKDKRAKPGNLQKLIPIRTVGGMARKWPTVVFVFVAFVLPI